MLYKDTVTKVQIRGGETYGPPSASATATPTIAPLIRDSRVIEEVDIFVQLIKGTKCSCINLF